MKRDFVRNEVTKQSYMEESQNIEIQALIRLLDDPDPVVFNTVSSNLQEKGIEVIPELEKAWETTLNEKIQSRLENIIQRIQTGYVKDKLGEWVSGEKPDLLEGSYYVAKSKYPELKFVEIEKKIENIRKDVWLEINENLTALEKVKVLNHIFFKVHKFGQTRPNLNDPQSNFLNIVLETGKGNPVSLGILYSVIAQKLGMPVLGVNIPRNFILAYMDEYKQPETFDEKTEQHILFYINTFNLGAVLGRREIDYFIKQQQLKSKKNFYIPCSNVEIIRRLILNLVFAYDQSGNKAKANRYRELLEVVREE